MEGGGGVVTTGWYRFGAIGTSDQGALDADAITPVVTGGTYNAVGTETLHITDGSHPITTGVADFPVISNISCCFETANALDAGAIALGEVFGDPSQMLIAYQDQVGRSVYLGPLYSAHESYDTIALRSGSPDRLLEQSVAWASGATSLTTVPEPASMLLVGGGVAALMARRRTALMARRKA